MRLKFGGVVESFWPGSEIEMVSVSHLMVARKALSETTLAAFRQLFAVRQAIARQVPGAVHITKPDAEKDAELPVHRGAAAVIDGTERTFLDRYGDYFWFALLLLSGIGSAGAWLRHYLNRDEREDNQIATVSWPWFPGYAPLKSNQNSWRAARGRRHHRRNARMLR